MNELPYKLHLTDIIILLRATACNASRVLAIVEVSVRLSVRHILALYQNGDT